MATKAPIPIGGEPPKAKILKREDDQWVYTHGDVSFIINTEDLGKALQQADEIGQPEAKRLMELNGMPVDPWVWRLARPVMLSYVQLIWYRHRGSKPEEEVKLIQKLHDREERYQQEVAKQKAKPPKPAKAISDAVRGGGRTITPQHAAGQPFQLRQDRKEIWEKFTVGQKATLIAKMSALGRPVSSSELAKLLEADGFKAAQPIERVTSFYFGEWKRNGLIEHVPSPSAEGSPAEAPKPEPAKTEQKNVTSPQGGSVTKKEGAKKK